MSPATVFGQLGAILWVVAAQIAVPLALAAVDGEGRTIAAYAGALLATLACALAFRFLGRGADTEMHGKDALVIVAFMWMFLGILGAVPFWIEGSITTFGSGVFEAVSGFTTTGATVVSDVGSLSRATNLWRCQMHWIGGMGIVVLFVAIFPQVGIGAKQLFKAEVAGPTADGLKPRIRETAMRLWWIYFGLTVLCFGLLWAEGMTPYDAVCHAMSTLGTGGFSTRSESLGYWSSPLIHWTINAFMLVAALNFGLFYGVLTSGPKVLLRDAELRFYVAVTLGVALVTAALIYPRHGAFEPALRHALFQVLAVTTTTGFMTEDMDAYPALPKLLLFFLMFMGGCAGLTAGGLKAVRVLLLLKTVAREFVLVVQPQAVATVRLGTRPVAEKLVRGVAVMAAAFFGVFAAGSVAVATTGADMMTSMSASIACLASVGPGFGGVGPTANFGWLPGWVQLVLCTSMIAGRLEVFALFAVFNPEIWRR